MEQLRETHPESTVRTTTSEGMTLVATAAGDREARPVLLFHGGGQTRHAWGGAVQALAAQGWRALSYDLPGHGESDWSPTGVYTFDLFADAVAGVARQFTAPVLVGASLGGIASLITIGDMRAAGVAGLVMVDVAPRTEQRGRDRINAFMSLGIEGFASLEEVADAIGTYTPGRPRPKDLSGLLKNLRPRPDGKWGWHWDPGLLPQMMSQANEPPAGSSADPARLDELAAKVDVPTLIVRGGSSDVVSVEGAAELKALIPHAEVVEVSGAGHMVAGDRNDRFTAALLEFLLRFPT